MKREEKVKEVELLTQQFKAANTAYLASFQGMKVESINQLRRKLRDNSKFVQVVKNTLAKRAIVGSQMEALKDEFNGATALIIPSEDPLACAKALVDFKKGDAALKLRRSYLEGQVLEVADVEQLAKIPSREELLARLAGSMKSTISNFVYALSGNYRRLVYALKAVMDKKEQGK